VIDSSHRNTKNTTLLSAIEQKKIFSLELHGIMAFFFQDLIMVHVPESNMFVLPLMANCATNV
jgi:hypothetical protein